MFTSSLALSALACPLTAQTAGIPPEWETRKDIETLIAQVKRIRPLLDELKLDDWVAKGASPAYISQLKSAQDAVGYIVTTAQRLAATPDRLTIVLETYFRLQSLDAILISLAEATSRYQNPALAQLLQGVAGENSANKEKLRQYLLDLAAVKEAEFKLIDQEAQRCRGVTANQPATKKGTSK
jgi:uncharacterized protein YfaS (alpha-2-macroglobulin family)